MTVTVILDEFIQNNDTGNTPWIAIHNELLAKIKAYANCITEDENGVVSSKDINVSEYTSNQLTFNGELQETETSDLILKPTSVSIPDGDGGTRTYSDLTGA